jgi:AcrR family transcriptional regulator
MPKLSSQSNTNPSLDGHAAGAQSSKSRGAGERILSTATELFARFGYNGVSTRDVASAAQVNEVTVYRHYPRKHDLYLAVLESELQQLRFRGDLLARIADASDGRTALTRSFELLTKTLMHRPEILRLLQYSALELNENFDPLVRRHLGELVEVVARYLEPWIKNGELRGANAKTVILTLIGIVISHNSLQRVFLGKELGPERMFEAYASFAFLEPGEGKKEPANQEPASPGLRKSNLD